MAPSASNVLSPPSPDAGASVPEPVESEKILNSAEGYWTESLRLEERLELWRRQLEETGEPAPVNAERAEKRLADLRTQKPFEDEEIWQRRLDAGGLSEDELRALLGLDPEWMERTAERPEWLDELAQAYRHDPAPSFPWPAAADLERCPFVPLVEPLVASAYERLLAEARQILERFPRAPFAADTAASALVAALPELLGPMLHRPMVVELHVAKLEERLRGDTGAERFQNFLAELRHPAVALGVLKQYPVLARQLVLRLGQWSRAAGDFLRHLAEDADALSERLFDGRPLGRLEVATGGVSDPHRGGRGVYLLGFDSGFRVVYKPKSMAVEVAFQGLQEWLNDRGFEPGFRVLGVVDRGDHGWMEMVDGRPCKNRDELARFYRRQGAYLALLYVLEATDFHHENLIAAGEHPVPVDLETLLQPWVVGGALDDPDSLPGSSVRSSLLRSNLLPEQWWGDGETAGVDLSGLTAREGQMTPQPVLATADVGTDSMRVERRRVEIPVAENRPRIEGADAEDAASALHHRADLEAGFRALYGLLLDRRTDLLAVDGPLAPFEEAEVRILFRQTATYGTLLLESFHPHVLTRDPARRALFDRLWAMSVKRPFLMDLVSTEIRELERGDIPLFTARGGSRDVETWDGHRFPGLLGESGMDRVRRRVEELGPSDLTRQLAVMHDSFDALRLGMESVPRPSFAASERDAPPSVDELCDRARKISRRIVDRAFVGRDESLWLTLHHGEVQGWHLTTTGPDVYAGLPGIAFALGYLGDLLGDPQLTDLARAALEAQRRQIDADPSLVQGLGGFNGWGGVIYVLTHLGDLWQDDALLDEAEAYAERLPPLIADDDMLDWIAGSAGCALALLGLQRVRPSADRLRTVAACGERILAKAEAQEVGLGWPMPLAGDRALAGLSHGAGGIALALLMMEDALGDARFRPVALEGIAYERSLFVDREQNWPDLRAGADTGPDGGFGHFMQAWCHGAPGIGLARVLGLPFLDDAETRAEIETAVRSTIAHGLGQNHCICHGDLGNLELLTAAGRALGREDWTARAGRFVGGVIDSMDRDGLLFGLPGSIETPGLMTGLAGLAYGLGRVAAPDRLPSILALEPPASSRSLKSGA